MQQQQMPSPMAITATAATTTTTTMDAAASFIAAISAVHSVDAGGAGANAAETVRRAGGIKNVQLPSTQAPWQLQQISEEEFFKSLPVFDMFPLSNGDENHVILYALLYAVLFLVGVCGNVSVITLIRHLHANTSYDNTMCYVLFLCCVDLASVVPLPMAIMDQLLGFWMFGTALCKVYRALEHVGRALSTFVLAAMAFDRYLRVCYPHKKTSRQLVLLQLFVLTLLTFVLLYPLLYNSSSREIVLKEVLLENPYRLARVRIFKCMDHLEGTMLSVFIMYMFLIGFFLPVLLITVFYALMMRRLYKRSRTMSSSKLPVNRIAGYTIAISVFFVLCWSPYWISMLYFNFTHLDNDDPEQNNEDLFSSDKFIYIMYGIHALPYVNSASNWLLYGLLNSQLMRRAKYTGDSTYYGAGGGAGGAGGGGTHDNNGYGPFVATGSLRFGGTHPSVTPPQPSMQVRFGGNSPTGSPTATTAAAAAIGTTTTTTTMTAVRQHCSLAVARNGGGGGGGKCCSTLSAPIGRVFIQKCATMANGNAKCGTYQQQQQQPQMATTTMISPSPSGRSISTISAPARTITVSVPSSSSGSESETEEDGGGSSKQQKQRQRQGSGEKTMVAWKQQQRLLPGIGPSNSVSSDNDVLL